MALIPENYLKEAGVRLVVIGCGRSSHIKPFREKTGYKHEMYVDPERTLYKTLGCKETLTTGSIKDSKHVKSGLLMGTMKATFCALKTCELQGNIKQQGASLVIGPGPDVHYFHIDTSSTEHCPINDLLALSGVKQVDFPKDKKVLIPDNEIEQNSNETKRKM